MKKITIKDIAREAGVSTATVSMVLNGKDQAISESTRKRVLSVVKERNFIPNAMAGSLVTRRTNIIGLIIPDIVNPFFPEIARGAEDRAKQAGCSLLLCNTDEDPEQEEKYLVMLSNKMVDGIIIAHSTRSTEPSAFLEQSRIPAIVIDRDWQGTSIQGRILVNNEKGAYLATKHLAEQGYRQIACITGPLKTPTSKDRLHGYQRALREYKLPVREEAILEGEYKKEWGKDAVQTLLTEKIPFDAIFCGNDLIAIGAIKELKRSGIRVPEDVGITGFDDISLASLVDPAITTVKQPNYEMGYQAVSMLLSIIDRTALETDQRINTLNTELVVRESSIKEGGQ